MAPFRRSDRAQHGRHLGGFPRQDPRPERRPPLPPGSESLRGSLERIDFALNRAALSLTRPFSRLGEKLAPEGGRTRGRSELPCWRWAALAVRRCEPRESANAPCRPAWTGVG